MLALNRLSIRTVLELVFGLLGLLLVASGVNGLSGTFEQYGAARKVASLAPVSQALFKAVYDARVERTDTLDASLGEAPVSEAAQAEIASDRRLAEEGYTRIMELLAALQLPDIESATARVKSAHGVLEAKRRGIDAAIVKAKPERDARMAEEWFAAVSTYLRELDATADLIEGALMQVDPVIDQLAMVKRAAWEARSHAGLTVVRITASLTTRQPWGLGEAVANAEDDGQAKNAWAIVTGLAGSVALSDNMKALIRKGNAGLTHGPAADERAAIARSLSAGRVPDIAAPDFLARQRDALLPSVDAAKMAMAEMVTYADQQMREATRSLGIHGLTFLIALGFTGVGFLMTRRQISSPILALAESMRRLADHDLAVEVPGVARGDEIGRMAKAVQVFKHQMIEADRLAGELHTAQEELVETTKLAFLGSMAGGIAHEVNTPIGICVTAMSTTDDLVLATERSLRERQLTEEGLLAFFAQMRSSAALVAANLQRAATLVRRFKDVATDQASETPRRLELGAHLDEIVASLQPELKRTHITVTVLCPQPVEVKMLAGALWQIVSNLVLNSVVHAFDPGAAGNITLSVAASAPGSVALTCADDGKGMPSSIRSRIFEPFFTTRRGQGGTGLGLFITYNLVTKTLGGRIKCDSAPGLGTRFDLILPAITPASAASAAEAIRGEALVA
ncbi:MAG: sensor histidine kinase [Hyphomicrobiales bacterium]